MKDHDTYGWITAALSPSRTWKASSTSRGVYFKAASKHPRFGINSFPAGGFASKLVNSLRTAVVTALWGTKRRSRCREIVLTLFVKGHLVDPLQNASYQCLRQLRRMAEQRPETFAELERVWQSYANGGEACDGPGKRRLSLRGKDDPT